MHNNKLHICIVTNQFPALTETFVTTKVLELYKRGHRITVVTNIEGGPVNSPHLELIKKTNITVVSFAAITGVGNMAKAFLSHPLLVAQSFSFSLSQFKNKYKAALQTNLLNRGYDIIHFEFSGLALAYLEAIKVLRAKKVVSCRGTAEKVKPISDPKRITQLKALFSAVEGIHCVSQDMANTIKPYLTNNPYVFVNRPSIDTGVFERSVPYNSSQNNIIILSIGRFTFQKGYLPGLLAAKILKQNSIKFIWQIVGDGPQHEELQYHIHTLGLGDNVRLLGKKNRNEILELYNTAGIFFLPSIYEGIANVCLEAMAMELPVVATKSGGMEEVIEHGIDGMLAETYHAADMAAKLAEICADESVRKMMGQKARKKVLAQFTLQRQVNEFEQQYYTLLK